MMTGTAVAALAALGCFLWGVISVVSDELHFSTSAIHDHW
jgi:hypothetical protein